MARAPTRRKPSKPSSRPPRGKGAPRKPVRRAPRPKLPRTETAVAANPRALKLAHRIAELALDKKALDVLILDVRGKTSYADYVVIASGESDRQVAATAEHVRAQLKQEQALSAIGSEGLETASWVLLDYGEVVVHLFLQEARAFYDLEGLWADAARENVA